MLIWDLRGMRRLCVGVCLLVYGTHCDAILDTEWVMFSQLRKRFIHPVLEAIARYC
jgi:hypothetical protein